MVTLSRIKTLLFLSSWFITPLWAWNSMGHQLVAQIAYDGLTPHAQEMYAHLFHQGKAKSFQNSAIWLDKIRVRQDPYYNEMHYIDIPFTKDGTPLPKIANHNAVSAIQAATLTLSSQKESLLHKKEAMKILLHVVGDIHQPLHAAALVSVDHKEGDAGGNLVLLKHNAIAKNLHQYWDKGAGVLIYKKHQHYLMITKMAKKLEQEYPCPTSTVEDPMLWANESNTIAQESVYTFINDSDLGAIYQSNAQRIVKQRIALAGCRLSELLNQIAMKNAFQHQAS